MRAKSGGLWLEVTSVSSWQSIEDDYDPWWLYAICLEEKKSGMMTILEKDFINQIKERGAKYYDPLPMKFVYHLQ